jgi:hypothetical protein
VKTPEVEVVLLLSSFIRRKEKKCRPAVGKILVAERFKI